MVKRYPAHATRLEDNEDVIEQAIFQGKSNDPQLLKAAMEAQQMFSALPVKASIEILSPKYKALGDWFNQQKEAAAAGARAPGGLSGLCGPERRRPRRINSGEERPRPSRDTRGSRARRRVPSRTWNTSSRKLRLGKRFEEVVEIMARLRSPEGCPWDREQDHRSLRQHLLEETYEVLDTIDEGDSPALRGELGDLLLQILFHSQLAAEEGAFDIGDVIGGLRDKLVARHPHVFGDKRIETAEGVVTEWESIKREERQQTPEEQAAAAAPKHLPALARAQTSLRKATRAGIERTAQQDVAAVEQALARLREEPEAAMGELLFAAVDLARQHGVEAEQVLRERVERFLKEVQGAQEP